MSVCIIILLILQQNLPHFSDQKVLDVSDFQKDIKQLRAIEKDRKQSQKKWSKSNFKKKAFVAKKLHIEINSSDTTTFKKLKGIGSTFASRICKFRNLLGGFYAKEQLLEVYGMDSLRYAIIEDELWVDMSKLQRLNINSIEIQELKSHPYLTYKQARSIVKYREQHGAYKAVADIKAIDLIEPSDFRKIAPYLKVHAQPKDSIRY